MIDYKGQGAKTTSADPTIKTMEKPVPSHLVAFGRPTPSLFDVDVLNLNVPPTRRISACGDVDAVPAASLVKPLESGTVEAPRRHRKRRYISSRRGDERIKIESSKDSDERIKSESSKDSQEVERRELGSAGVGIALPRDSAASSTAFEAPVPSEARGFGCSDGPSPEKDQSGNPSAMDRDEVRDRIGSAAVIGETDILEGTTDVLPDEVLLPETGNGSSADDGNFVSSEVMHSGPTASDSPSPSTLLPLGMKQPG